MKKDIRIGTYKPRLLRNPIEWLAFHIYRRKHKKLHNENSLFYPTQPHLLEAIVRAIDLQLFDGEFTYYEFGVFKGFSLWFAQMYAKTQGIRGRYYGFDSFEGLPETKVDNSKPAFNKGHYAASIEDVAGKFQDLEVNPEEVKLIKGFYSKELFDDIKKQHKFEPISICVIDVDIYESCVEVLDFIKDYLVSGSILLFDDYNLFEKSDEHGERRALKEFKKKHPLKLEKLFDFGYGGRAFKVL